MQDFQKDYSLIQNGGTAYYANSRGLFRISGGEAIQFLNGLITNDITKLRDGKQMLAAFPTLRGRIFAIARVLRNGSEFLFETEQETRRKVCDNLFRFTFAGDFQVEDFSDKYECFSIFGSTNDFRNSITGALKFNNDYLVPKNLVEEFRSSLGDAAEISDKLYEVLRIENGIPKYGVDMDEETVVPEVGLDGMISYDKGCYIGQEIIARIHFRGKGKVAKKLTGLVFDNTDANIAPKMEIISLDNKNAGKVTSITFSPRLGKVIALSYVRNAYLKDGTELKVGNCKAKVTSLPFIK